MAAEQDKGPVYKMLAVFGAGIVSLINCLYFIGGDVRSAIIGFVFAFIIIALFVTASRMAKKIKKETAGK
jgi:uncharacterized membrane protein YjjP (DUF1212 family)